MSKKFSAQVRLNDDDPLFNVELAPELVDAETLALANRQPEEDINSPEAGRIIYGRIGRVIGGVANVFSDMDGEFHGTLVITDDMPFMVTGNWYYFCPVGGDDTELLYLPSELALSRLFSESSMHPSRVEEVYYGPDGSLLGLIVDVSITMTATRRAFLPLCELDGDKCHQPELLLGQPLNVRIVLSFTNDQGEHIIVASNRTTSPITSPLHFSSFDWGETVAERKVLPALITDIRLRRRDGYATGFGIIVCGQRLFVSGYELVSWFKDEEGAPSMMRLFTTIPVVVTDRNTRMYDLDNGPNLSNVAAQTELERRYLSQLDLTVALEVEVIGYSPNGHDAIVKVLGAQEAEFQLFMRGWLSHRQFRPTETGYPLAKDGLRVGDRLSVLPYAIDIKRRHLAVSERNLLMPKAQRGVKWGQTFRDVRVVYVDRKKAIVVCSSPWLEFVLFANKTPYYSHGDDLSQHLHAGQVITVTVISVPPEDKKELLPIVSMVA